MELEIITPTKVVFKDTVSSVIMPSQRGEMEVLSGHENYIVSLKKGNIRVNRSSDEAILFRIAYGGIARITAKTTTILAQEASEAK